MCFNSQAMSLGIQQKPKLREISLVPNNLILFLGIQSMPNTREHILLLYLDNILIFCWIKVRQVKIKRW